MKRTQLLLFLILFQGLSAGLFAQTKVSGKVTDAASGEALIGASVSVFGTSNGTFTDDQGIYEITISDQTTTIRISYVGYKAQEVSIDGRTTINIALEGGISLDEVVVSASRKPEKITDAPSSISIINPRAVEAQIASSPTLLLNKTQGVQIVQMGADRFQIALRGQSSTFLSGTFVMLDNRPLTSLSEQTYFFQDNPFPKLDIEKVEVIRGPGSALYGGNVTSGVVHYITKSPFSHPGTTVEVAGGTQSTIQVAARHAGHDAAGKWGYKINAFYKRGNEWQYDPEDALDRTLLGNIRPRSIDKNGDPIFELEQRMASDGFTYFAPQDYLEYYGGNASLEYRPTDDLSVTGVLGYSKTDGSFWTTNGFGIRRPSNFNAQLRVSGKNTFFSTSWSLINQGFEEGNVESLINVGPPPVGSSATPQRKGNFDAQLQHRIAISDNFNLVVGGDARIGNTDSQGKLFGRYEEDNDIEIFGAYAQADYDFSEKFSLTGALRYDYFAPLEQGRVSPRLAAVIKPDANTSIRASFNQAFAAPGAIQLYIDLGPLNPVFQGGGVPGPPIGFQRNVGSSAPLTFGSSPISFAGSARALGESGADKLISHQSVINALISANPELAGLLNGINTNATSTPRTVAINNGGAVIGEAPVIDNRKLEITEQTTYEIGITTLIKSKLVVNLDLYYNDIKNAASISTPFTRGVTSGGLADDVMGTINGSTSLTAEQQTSVMNALLAIFPNSDESIIGAIQSEQIRASVSGGEIGAAPVPDGIWIERNFFSASAIDYVGWDLGLKYFINNDFSLFLNYSGLSETEFVDSGIPYNLNTPKTRLGLGFDYVPAKGFSSNANLRYQDAFNVINGFYSGAVDAYTLLDLGVGYTLGNGLSFGATATNVTGVDFRPLPNLPAIGTQVLFRVKYSFN